MRTQARRALVSVGDAVDPFRALAHLGHIPDASVLCIYRARHAARVEQIVRHAADAGSAVRLWGLDDIVPSLRNHTVGSGPGTRFQILNRLTEGIDANHWIVVTDDDVRFGRRGLSAFLKTVHRLDLELAQPAHARRGSHYFHPLVRRRPLRLGRLTTFVEIGPTIAIAPSARGRVIPFNEDGMGWGVELVWFDLQQRGLRLGIVDATPIRHLDPAGVVYDDDAERRRLDALLAERGLASLVDIQRDVASLYF